MRYGAVSPAVFMHRPNRFVARCLLDGREVAVHVKNTGRCRELLVPGARVYLEHASGSNRKTEFSLIAVEKGTLLINIDSQAPNAAAAEALATGLLPELGGRPSLLRREAAFGDSRLDFYLKTGRGGCFLEVKGVTLEDGGAGYFPDAPTLRGQRHVKELIRAVEKGYDAALLFVVQFSPVSFVSPYDVTMPSFREALCAAKAAGVRLLAYDCAVTPNSMTLRAPVEVRV